MEMKSKGIVVLESDYKVMSSYIKGVSSSGGYDNTNAANLLEELNRAVVVNRSLFPKKVVRINSRVLVKEEKEGQMLDITVVTPEKADIKTRKISFMAPIGMALLGFKEGDKVKWRVPSGEKVFVIMKVTN